MFDFVLQDWTTLLVDKTIKNVVQTEELWLDLSAFQDVVFYYQVTAKTTPAGTSMRLILETAPSKDEALFQSMGFGGVSASTSPTLVPVLLSSFDVAPLAQWARWRLHIVGNPDSVWGTCFRILGAANRVSAPTEQTKDESDFYLMQTQDPLTLGVAVLPVLTISLPGGVPLSKWVRWHLYHSGAGTTIDYGATFRILCAANAVGTI
jgi:hypothetical protein